jgi:hypothetical protein
MGCSDCHGGQNFVGCTEPDGGVMVECGPCPPTCSAFDETSCNANDYCHPGYCAGCSGGQIFRSCLGPNEAVACSKSTCPAAVACATVPDEATCKGRNDCHGLYCPDCNGGLRYLGCGDLGTTVACDDGCPAFKPCAAVTTSAECDARMDCHSVFDNWHCPSTAAVCPVTFTKCADGGKTSCKGPTGQVPFCAIEPPPCAASGYVVSYLATVNCYEGCVRAVACAP